MPTGVRRSTSSLLALVNPGEPLWKIVPTRDEDGKLLGDFMMLIPGLREQPAHRVEATLGEVHCALVQFQDVVFANMNLRLNLLWVSFRARPRIMLEIAAAVRQRVPEAVLVGDRPRH